MDSTLTEGLPVRRFTRRTSERVIGPTPRDPIKRSRKASGKQAPVSAVNGSDDVEDGRGDEESPRKKIRLEADGEVGAGGDDVEMEVEESAEDTEKNKARKMDNQQDRVHQTKTYQDASGEVNLSPQVNFGKRCQTAHTVNKEKDQMKKERVRPAKEPVGPTKTVEKIRPLPQSHGDMLQPKITSMAEYQKTMKANSRSFDLPSVNHRPLSSYPASEKLHTTQRPVNNLRNQNEAVKLKKQEVTKKVSAIKRSSAHSSRGLRWYLWCLVLLVMLGSALFMAHKFTIAHLSTAGRGEPPSRAVKPEVFAEQLSLLELRFPSQRLEVWERSEIHLEKHLRAAHPSEPVSLILTAGHQAERTLHCLAQGMASAFSTALNASVLHIDGAGKASQDSDQVKLDIDSQLRAAFEGDKLAAVIHRFEELPPGSTLIFYRYCDHENAAYKRGFLLFTVLMPQGEVEADLSLRDVEEKVHDYVRERLVGQDSQTAFNKMDNDKFSGLWSRISHLILPVVYEEEAEQNGC